MDTSGGGGLAPDGHTDFSLLAHEKGMSGAAVFNLTIV
jgi:hypothetical protein